MNVPAPHHAHGVGVVLAESRHLFVAGLFSAFPWVLAAEIVAALPVAGAGKSLLNTDLSQLLQPAWWAWNLLSACLQAGLYAYAIARLARRDPSPVGVKPGSVLKTTLALLIAYLIYELLVLFGLGLALILFLPVLLLFGVFAGLLVALIPLAPTAWISTALAFFAYPVVLERHGPFDALGRSLRLARLNWAHAALVVSVPAIALLCVAVLQNVLPVMHALHEVTTGLAHQSSSLTTAQLQDLLTSLSTQATADTHPLWQTVTLLLSALAWWYSLTVCYVEYKMLNSLIQDSGNGMRDSG